jgi:hypothetical protein
MSNPKMFASAAALLLSFYAQADVVFRDGTLNQADWVVEQTQTGAGGSVTRNQIATTGNPGSLLRIKTTVNAGSNAGISGLLRYGTTLDTRYDPLVSGAIDSIDFSIDYRANAGSNVGQNLWVALKQSTSVYIAAVASTGFSTDWQTRSVMGVRASDFTLISGAAGTPDFSRTGTPIRFGFVVANSTTSAGYNVTIDYDNFNLVAHNVPGAGSFAVLGTGLVCTRRRRRTLRG